MFTDWISRQCPHHLTRPVNTYAPSLWCAHMLYTAPLLSKHCHAIHLAREHTECGTRALQEIRDHTSSFIPSAGAVVTLSACLPPACLVCLPLWQARALREQHPSSPATVAAEAFIWQGNRISSTELPPATTHTHTDPYIKPRQCTQTEREIEFHFKVARRKTSGVGLFVPLFLLLPCYAAPWISKLIRKHDLHYGGQPPKKNKISLLMMSRGTAQRQRVQHTAICHKFHSNVDVPG